MSRLNGTILIRISLWSAVSLVVLAVLSVAVTAATTPACSSCHAEKAFVSETEKSPHAQVSCQRCHVPSNVPGRLSFGGTQVFGMALRIMPVGGRAAAMVPDATCLSCHEPVTRGVTTSNGYSIQHSTCAAESVCVDCHSYTAHGTATRWVRTSQMDKCLACHNTTEVSKSCTTCHVERSPRQRLAAGTWRVTHGPNWRQTHGMGDNRTCAACHPNDYCARCHVVQLPHGKAFLDRHAEEARDNLVACRTCHQQEFCDDCHGIKMPHGGAFAKDHGDVVRANGRDACNRCHLQVDCDDCHMRHVHPGGALPFGKTTITNLGTR